MPCLGYFTGVFISAYGKVVISTAVVCGLVGGAKLVEAIIIVKCEQGQLKPPLGPT